MSASQKMQKAAWVAVAVWLVAAPSLLWAHYVTALRAIELRGEAYFRSAAADERLVRSLARIDALQQRANADISRVALTADPATALSTALAVLQEQAGRSRVELRGVSPMEAPVQDGAGAALARSRYTILVRGRYAALMQFVQRVPAERAALQIDALRLERTAEPKRGALIDAQVQLTVLRLRNAQ